MTSDECGLFGAIQGLRNPTKFSVMIASIRVENRTRDLLNTKQRVKHVSTHIKSVG
jgi:hypothetical protein